MQTQSLSARELASKSRSERIERARSAREILVYIYIYIYINIQGADAIPPTPFLELIDEDNKASKTITRASK